MYRMIALEWRDRVAWLQAKGQVPVYEAFVSKVFGSELNQRIADAGLQVLGLRGQLGRGSKYTVLEGLLQSFNLYNVSLTLARGTSEVRRQITANKGLGLLRE